MLKLVVTLTAASFATALAAVFGSRDALRQLVARSRRSLHV